jgi:hypothetical protein
MLTKRQEAELVTAIQGRGAYRKVSGVRIDSPLSAVIRTYFL